MLNADQIAQRTALLQREQQNQAAPDWWTRIGVVAAIIIGLMQTAVFGYQAVKLRQTVKDGEEAIKAATKAANAASRQARIAETALRTFEIPQIVLDLHDIKVRPVTQVANKLRGFGSTTILIAQIEFFLRNVGRSTANSLIVETSTSLDDGAPAKRSYNIGSLLPNEATKPILVGKAKDWPDTWFSDVAQSRKTLRMYIKFQYLDQLGQTTAISQSYRYDTKGKRFLFDGPGTKAVSNEFNPEG